MSGEHKADADMLAAQLEAKVLDLETCRRDRTQLTRENNDLRTRLQRAEELLSQVLEDHEVMGRVDEKTVNKISADFGGRNDD